MASWQTPRSAGRKCSRCGYDLVGLGDKGACPECGQRFDAYIGLGFKRESTPGDRVEAMNKRMRTISIGVLGLLAMGCAGLFAATIEHWQIPIAIGALVVLAAGFAVVISYIREKRD